MKTGRLLAWGIWASVGTAAWAGPGETPAADDSELQLFQLEESLNRLVEISTKTKIKLDEAPATVSVIDRADIESSGARTLGDVMRMVPGFQSMRTSLGNGEPVDQFLARGVKSDFGQTVLVLLNGANTFNDLVFASTGLATRIDADMIERVEVIRGPGSALYGGSAFAGVINVITRGVEGADLAELKASYASYQRVDASALFRRHLGQWRLGLQGKFVSEEGRSYPALLHDRSYDPGSGGMGPIPQAALVKDGIRPSFDLAASIASPDDRYKLQAWFTDHNPDPWLTGFYPNPALSQYRNQAIQGMVSAEARPVDGLLVRGYYSNMYRKTRTVLSPVLGPVAIGARTEPSLAYGPADIFGTVQHNDDLQGEVSYQRSLGPHELLVGATGSRLRGWGSEATYYGKLWDPTEPAREITSTDPREGLIAYPTHSRYTLSAYAQDIWQIVKPLAVTLGVRADHYSDVSPELIVSPRLAAVFTPVHNHVFKLIYGQGFRPPSLFEQRGIFFGALTGSPGVRPERMNTLEATYIAYFGAVRLSATGYYSRVTDSIITVDVGDPIIPNRFSNSGQVSIWGGEIELQGKYAWVNYSPVDSRSTVPVFGGGYVSGATPFIPAQSLNGGIRHEIFERLEASTQVFVRSPIRGPTGPASDWYVDLDARLAYRLPFGSVFAGARNLLDQRYELPLNDQGTYTAPYRGREYYVGAQGHLP